MTSVLFGFSTFFSAFSSFYSVISLASSTFNALPANSVEVKEIALSNYSTEFTFTKATPLDLPLNPLSNLTVSTAPVFEVKNSLISSSVV